MDWGLVLAPGADTLGNHTYTSVSCEQQSNFEDTPKTLCGRAPTVLQHHEWLDGVYHNAACAHKKRCQAHARINSSLVASGEVTCVQSWPLHAAETRLQPQSC